MIWVAGRIVAAEALVVPATDRIFEHGLGLFETFRTWNGVAPWLGRHLARVEQSSRTLGIPINPAAWPTPAAVATLTAAHNRPDSLIRLTASGGRPGRFPATVWLTAAPLPPAPPAAGYRVVDAPWTVALDDPLSQHKTLNYWSRRNAHEAARATGADEAMLRSADGRFWEGSRTNLFLIVAGRVITPPSTGPIIPGIMRQLVLDHTRAAGLATEEVAVTPALIESADAIFLTNSVRGLIPVREWSGRSAAVEPDFPAVAHLRSLIDDSQSAPRVRA